MRTKIYPPDITIMIIIAMMIMIVMIRLYELMNEDVPNYMNFSYGTPLAGCDNAATCGTQLDALSISPNSSKNHLSSTIALT